MCANMNGIEPALSFIREAALFCVLVTLSSSSSTAFRLSVPGIFVSPEQNRENDQRNVGGVVSLRDLVLGVNDKLQIIIDKMDNADHNIEMLKLKYETLSVKENYLDQKLGNVGEKLGDMDHVIGDRLNSMQAKAQEDFTSLGDQMGKLKSSVDEVYWKCT